jgi:hypothetical protein
MRKEPRGPAEDFLMGIAPLQIINSTLSRQYSPLAEDGEVRYFAVQCFRESIMLQDKIGQCIAS